jgi:hypothetical protein
MPLSVFAVRKARPALKEIARGSCRCITPDVQRVETPSQPRRLGSTPLRCATVPCTLEILDKPWQSNENRASLLS